MADRRRQIILLLSSRFDFTFEPETFTGKVVRRSTQTGTTATAWIDCKTCTGDGGRYDRFRTWTPCDACHGKGTVKVDAYTSEPGEQRQTDNQQTPVGMTWSEHFRQLLDRDTRRVKCPDCQDLAGNPTGLVHNERCRRCDGTGEASVAGSWLSAPVAPGETGDGDTESALLNAIERRDHAGHYRQLEQALAGISRHVNKPNLFLPLTLNAARARRLLDELYLPPVTVTLEQLPEADRQLVELALAYIDLRMPDPIRVPAAIVANQATLRNRHTVAKRATGSDPRAIAQRDREIIRHARDGRSPQWIAQQYQLAVSTVYAVVKAADERTRTHV